MRSEKIVAAFQIAPDAVGVPSESLFRKRKNERRISGAGRVLAWPRPCATAFGAEELSALAVPGSSSDDYTGRPRCLVAVVDAIRVVPSSDALPFRPRLSVEPWRLAQALSWRRMRDPPAWNFSFAVRFFVATAGTRELMRDVFRRETALRT
jgi:hypothetical protein